MKKIRIAASVMAAAMVFTSGAFSKNIGSSSAIADTRITFEQFDKNINGGEPIRGVDISSIIALEKSGVTFKDENGNEQDIFKTLSEHGVNYIRVRVWNEPYDSNGNGYGGGNNDVYTAGLIGKRAAEYGMKLLVDIHYSDFWADPAKQTRPKYWAEHNNTKLAGEIYKWTSWGLQSVSEAGGDIGMVQVGNETNCFFCGEKDMYEICKLFASGNKAVRDFDKNILIAHHFANPSTGHYDWYAKVMNECKLDYDVFATSYYPYWHGSIENMKKVMNDIGDKYNKYVMVAEVAYPYTNEDGDHFGNSVTSSSSGCDFAYEISVDGQADCLTDVFKAVSEMNGHGIGVFYWEPAWIGADGSDYDKNKELWEKYGSGWATSYAAEFDKDVDKTGGSSFDNQALFDFSGKPLDSLNVFLNVYPQAKKQVTTTTTTTASATTTVTTTASEVAVPEKSCRIMAIGDSITDGYGVEGSYRKFLCNGLAEKGINVDMVGSKGGGMMAEYKDEKTGKSFRYDNDNTGYSGYAIQEYSGRNGILETLRSTDCLSENPDIVILQIGTNDVIDNHELDKAGERLSGLVKYILENIPENSALFVTTIPDVDPNCSGVYEWFDNYRHSADWQTQYDDTTAESNIHKAVAKYNSDVQAVVEAIAKTDSRVHFADVNSAVTDVKSQLGDGVHPNNDGYKAMGDYWTDIISDFIIGSPVTVTTKPANIMIGDLNGDKTVDVYDLIALRKAVLKKACIAEGDFNKDKELGVADLVSMQSFLLGKKSN